MVKKLVLLFYTLRFLKPIQFYWRIYLKLVQYFPISTSINGFVKTKDLRLTPSIRKNTTLLNNQFSFLNETSSSELPIDWNASQMSKLWLYNLHYFDYINQDNIDNDIAFELIHDWINKNPVGIGNGWEPYPLSLRIVNWIKFISPTNHSSSQLTQIHKSLFLQARFLFRHLEYHLLGNHLFKNGVALMFAGTYFEGEEAEYWLKKGVQIITEQVKEQVLDDGGHFERSPMYHVLILEDILDCLNLDQLAPCFAQIEAAFIKNKATAMLGFLVDIVHQDGEIPFFNDSALKIAPNPGRVFEYASSLGFLSTGSDITLKGPKAVTIVEKPDFGLYVMQNQTSRMIFDAGAVGPDYLPGHAHCDTLSYELSIGGYRCIVNSGTYQYAGENRNDFRATKAHNTVKIDGAEQHEIWSTFRVARRGYPMNLLLNKQDSDLLEFSASHSGFKRLPGKPVHKRSVRYNTDQIYINDAIEGSGEHLAESFIHLHPDIEIINDAENVLECKHSDVSFTIQPIDNLTFEIEKGWFSPEFGKKIETYILVLRKQAVTPFSFGYTINF